MELPLLKGDIKIGLKEQMLDGFNLSEEKTDRLKTKFIEEVDLGLKHGLEKSSLQMENTYVPDIIDGSEDGMFLALDLGGTNFRVLLCKLVGGKIIKEEIKHYIINEMLRTGPGIKLFDFLAACIANFLQESDKSLAEQELIPLSFTFSFPMTQEDIDKGILVAWTKSFSCSGVVGEDAARLLTESLQKIILADKGGKRLAVKVVAILNDTTGTLVMGSHDNNNTCIGLGLGTGANCAYFEQSANVSRWNKSIDRISNNVIVDSELGAFGDNGCIGFLKTDIDQQIDEQSMFPGSFTYEKYFSGKYLGNILRLILWRQHKSGQFLNGQLTCLGENDAITAEDVSNMVRDLSTGQTATTISTLGNLITTSSKNICDSDVLAAQTASYVISERCALLIAIPLAVFLERIGRGRDEVSAIAVTGSLYQNHPTLKDSIKKYTKRWTNNMSQINVFESVDGSGKGAALVAAIAARINSN